VPPRENPSVAFLFFVGKTYSPISGILSKYNIKTVGIPPKKSPVSSGLSRMT
jgi:hypothetical protein